MLLTFNPTPLARGRAIASADAATIKGTPSLWNADPDDAARFGGDLTRAALGACRFRGDRQYIVVDTKIHMLMPGMLPAIPGWHTDGVPRDLHFRPDVPGAPRLDLQVRVAAGEAPHIRPPRYHLLVTGGAAAPTEFLAEAWDAEFPAGEVPDLYSRMTRMIEQERGRTFGPRSLYVEDGQVYEFGWWDVHRAIPAREHGWRFLMRATETDSIEPQTDLRSVIRMHNPVYVTDTYGW